MPPGQPSDPSPAAPNPDNVADTREVIVDDEGLCIATSVDHLGAFVTIAHGYEQRYSPQSIMTALHEAGIVQGVKMDRIQAIFAERKFGVEQLVAWGKPTHGGQNGRLELLFSLEASKPDAEERASLRRVDYRQQSHVPSVKKGDLLVRRHPAKPGLPGIDVHGKEVIPASVQDVKMPKGKNTEMDEDGFCLYAAVDGLVSQTPTSVDVSPVVEIKGDVDFSTGNITFPGSVHVSGNVLVDFEIRAECDIRINGVVEGALLQADGEIAIQRGVQGNGKARLQAKTITASFLSGASVVASTVTINGPILHCNVNADRVSAGGSKGIIAGGRVHARYGIECLGLGTEVGVRTEVFVGVDPAIRRELNKIGAAVQKAEEQVAKLVPAVEGLRKVEAESKGGLSAGHQKFLEDALHTKAVMEKQIAEHGARRDELLAEEARLRKAEIHVKGPVHPGAVVHVGDATHEVDVAAKFTRFTRNEDGEIEMHPLT